MAASSVTSGRAVTMEFIEKYRTLECLWKVTDKHYKNKQHRQRAVEALLPILKKIDSTANVDSVHKKINSLRSAFNKEHSKVKAANRSGIGADEEYIPKLWYYDFLFFLNERETEVGTSCDINAILNNEENDESNDQIILKMSDPAPLSKTAKYKKITKPLLERKRRARINRCLDELKDLMVGALEIDDDNLSKLEKADILELTVNHLTKLHSPKDPVLEAKKFQAGFGQCAAEACRFIMSVPDLDSKVSQNLISHLSRLITAQPLTIQVPERPHFSPPTSPSSMVSDRQHYYSDPERSSSDAEDSIYAGDNIPKPWGYGRPPPRVTKASAPTSGLLTTIDKVPVYNNEETNGSPRTGTYFNRVPVEAKDVILQKIRQHIMDKRGNDTFETNPKTGPIEPKYLHREEPYRGEYVQQYETHASHAHTNNVTLDLRKIRSPVKYAPETSPKIQQNVQLEPVKAENKTVEATVNLPGHESPMDYSNLPPKKKRKLIEYQEFMKQEEARRQLDAFYDEKRDERPSAELDGDSKWRPW